MHTSEVVASTTKSIDQNLQMLNEHLFNLEGRLDAAKDLLYLCELDEEEWGQAQDDLTECRDSLYTLMSKIVTVRSTIQYVHDKWS